MLILLINSNQIVQKLVEVTASRANVSLVSVALATQIQDINHFDYVFVDDEAYIEQKEVLDELLQGRKKCLIYAKSGTKIEGFDKYVRKPFIPTQVLEILLEEVRLMGEDEANAESSIAREGDFSAYNSNFDTSYIEQEKNELDMLQRFSEDSSPNSNLDFLKQDFVSIRDEVGKSQNEMREDEIRKNEARYMEHSRPEFVQIDMRSNSPLEGQYSKPLNDFNDTLAESTTPPKKDDGGLDSSDILDFSELEKDLEEIDSVELDSVFEPSLLEREFDQIKSGQDFVAEDKEELSKEDSMQEIAQASMKEVLDSAHLGELSKLVDEIQSNRMDDKEIESKSTSQEEASKIQDEQSGYQDREEMSKASAKSNVNAPFSDIGNDDLLDVLDSKYMEKKVAQDVKEILKTNIEEGLQKDIFTYFKNIKIQEVRELVNGLEITIKMNFPNKSGRSEGMDSK